MKAARAKGSDGALAITALPLPPGITVAAATIADKASDGHISISTTATLPLGMVTVGLQAKGKLAGAEHKIGLPVVTLNVVQPATIELSTPNLQIKPANSVEIKGKIVRKGGFAGPVTVKVSGLPAGLKADPVTVAGNAADFVVKVAADAKAAPATATAQVAIAYQIDKKDYSVPPAALAVKVVAAK